MWDGRLIGFMAIFLGFPEMQPGGLLGVVLSGVMEQYYGKGMKDWSSDV